MSLLEQLTGVGAEPLAQVPLVPRVTVERRRRAADDGLAAQQVGEQRLVLWPLRVRQLENGQGVRVRPGPAGRARQDHPGGGGVRGGRAADLRQRAGVLVAHTRQAGR